MAEMIKCPNCDEMNPRGQATCKNCLTPLLSVTGELDEDAFIKPGQAPTKKNTAELEPILPQWLRDARDAARKTDEEGGESLQHAKQTSPASSEDLLSGLRSQTSDDEEDEVPDWLASITGTSSKQKPPEAETFGTRWVELGGSDDFAQTDNSETPSWLAGLQQPDSLADEKDELAAGWTQETDQPSGFQAPEQMAPFDEPVSDISAGGTPDWLRKMSADADSKSEDTSADTPQDAPELPIDAPDWLRGLGGTAESTQGRESAGFSESNTSESEASFSSADMPDWLKVPAPEEKPLQDTTPPWLKNEMQNPKASEPPSEPRQESTGAQDDVLGDLPDWLKAAAPQSSIFNQPEEQPEPEPEAPSDTPDWLKTFASSETPSLSEPDPASKTNTPFEAPPAFIPGAESNENLDDLFTEMPDWLSGTSDTPAPETPAPAASEDALKPSELPAWVQAMRPVESTPVQPSAAGDQTLESRGALAGLQGVLPAVPGFAPTSKPKTYSNKLQASDEQLGHAEILEQLLAAETSPVPIESFSHLRASRSLRWFLAFIVLSIALFTTALNTRIFSMPLGVPNEVRNAMLVSQSLPQNAPVLVAFDYEPSRAGEMEAAAVPLLDQIILFSHPRLTFISTSQTGSILAERFITGPLAEHYKNGGFTYLNLGYLPGGQMGIRAFAQNPPVASPLDINLQPAWGTAPLEGVASFPQFAALILLTDNADAARVWVEQTESLRGSMPFLVVSSSQAAPMIQPYHDSAQVNGMIPGLYGGALFEQFNAGRPGTARNYWDAYSLGMLAAMALTLGGSLWNLALGLRDRRTNRETKTV